MEPILIISWNLILQLGAKIEKINSANKLILKQKKLMA